MIYVARAGEVLELAATFGLNVGAVGRTRLRIGEGIIGMVAASGDALNLPDAQNHPRYVYRPELGEEELASMLAMPVKRAGRILGVIALMSREARAFSPVEVEAVATVAMLLAEIFARAGATDCLGGRFFRYAAAALCGACALARHRAGKNPGLWGGGADRAAVDR